MAKINIIIIIRRRINRHKKSNYFQNMEKFYIKIENVKTAVENLPKET